MRATVTALLLAAALGGPALAQPAGDPADGADVYQDRCNFCHVLGGKGQGPNLAGVVGRKAGAVPDFGYTAALRDSGKVWTRDQLDLFLLAPRKLVPGTAMVMMVPDPKERLDLIAYLASLK